MPPVRSISLPSKLYPTSIEFEAGIDKPRKWETSYSSTAETLGADTIQNGLISLGELYNSVDELINSPITQKALIHHQHREMVEEALNESVILLDTCDTARNIVLTLKARSQDLQSSLRRKVGLESDIEHSILDYINFRKKAKKEISKCIGSLKQVERRIGSSSTLLVVIDPHLLMAIRLLKELSTMAISVFRSLLLFLSMPLTKMKINGWSLISKLVAKGSFLHEKEPKITSEVNSVDFAIWTLRGHVRTNDSKSEVKMLQRKLEKLVDAMDGLEVGLNLMFRSLVQYRVSLLNLLNH